MMDGFGSFPAEKECRVGKFTFGFVSSPVGSKPPCRIDVAK